MEEEHVGLCDLPGFDPPGTRRRLGRSIKTFEQWIEHEPLERWSLLHDTFGAGYGVMTTNLAKRREIGSRKMWREILAGTRERENMVGDTGGN